MSAQLLHSANSKPNVERLAPRFVVGFTVKQRLLATCKEVTAAIEAKLGQVDFSIGDGGLLCSVMNSELVIF